LAYADDIALIEKTLSKALLHCVERESQTIGLFLNSTKTKVIHLNPTSDDSLYAIDGSIVEKFDEFL